MVDPKMKQIEGATEPSSSPLDFSSSGGGDLEANNDRKQQYLPILIVPGFMSSGLEIQESTIKSSWEGKRVWLNLQSIGFSALYVGSAQKQQQRSNDDSSNNDEEEQEQQKAYKSQWLEHMRLGSDRCSDPPGIQVRAITGLEGVDYLTPGALTNHVSYVFGPVIDALQKAGYTTRNLQAAPYDWRLPPAYLEKRDHYFSRLAQQVEELYQNNNGTPIVLLGHSLGSKTAHYFLDFALQQKGQAWLDRYIHTYLPVGAPHLGAPKALRGMISGDDMGLGTFLSDEEALVMGRSFGSCPWMMPSNLPEGAPSNAYILPYGVLEITFPSGINTHPFIENRTATSKPNRFQLIMSYGKKKSIRTPFTGVSQDDNVLFSDKLSFGTSPNPLDENSQPRLRLFLQEPGIALAKTEKRKQTCCGRICCFLKWITCCCILENLCKLILLPIWVVLKVSVMSADAATSGAGGGTTLAYSTPMVIPREVWKGKAALVEMELCHKDDYDDYSSPPCCGCGPTPRTTKVQVQIRWIAYDKRMSKRNICSPVSQPCLDVQAKPLEVARWHFGFKKNHPSYQEYPGNDLLEREGLEDTLHLIRRVYDGDDVEPRTTSAPPVQRIHAIYGVNLPTEVGCAYKRKDRCESSNKTENLFALDSKAYVVGPKKSEYYLRGGILYETSKTQQEGGQQICGDGTVPYYSLQHCKTWKSEGKDVSVVELEKAEHREILADPRFHNALLDYCCVTQETA